MNWSRWDAAKPGGRADLAARTRLARRGGGRQPPPSRPEDRTKSAEQVPPYAPATPPKQIARPAAKEQASSCDEVEQQLPARVSFFAGRPREAGPRPPALPQARPDAGMGREQLLPAAHPAADRRPGRGQRLLGRLRQARRQRPRSCSQHLADASRNFTEMMFALAVLDLPFEAAKHESKFDGRQDDPHPGRPGHRVPRGSPAAPAAPDGKLPILVSQNFYRHGDRYRDENGEQFDKFVTDEFLVHTVYGCQVVVTNPTLLAAEADVLLQLPVGAIPVLNGQYTSSRAASTWSRTARRRSTTYFYFPQAGQVRCTSRPTWPRTSSRGRAPPPVTFKVVDKPTQDRHRHRGITSRSTARATKCSPS